MKNSQYTKTGVVRIIAAGKNSLAGLKAAWHYEAAFRQELVLGLILIIAAIFLPVNYIERILLIGSVFAVLVVELLNSAIEHVVDRISLEIHPQSKIIKDLASAAVLLSLLAVLLVWVSIVGRLLFWQNQT